MTTIVIPVDPEQEEYFSTLAHNLYDTPIRPNADRYQIRRCWFSGEYYVLDTQAPDSHGVSQFVPRTDRPNTRSEDRPYFRTRQGAINFRDRLNRDHSARLLSCGHLPSGPHENYAVTINGDRICLSCAEERERVEMYIVDTYGGYLCRDEMMITNWPGGQLIRLVCVWPIRHNLRSCPVLLGWSGYDRTGHWWHGKCAGDQMHTTMHRNHDRRRYPPRTMPHSAATADRW